MAILGQYKEPLAITSQKSLQTEIQEGRNLPEGCYA